VSTHKTASDLTDWITLSQAARLRGVSRQAISKLVKQGRLKTLDAGGRPLVYKPDVSAFKPLPAGRKGKAKR
jgi:excisionase family DNA binding protein